MSHIVLETDRLILRQLEWEDLDALARIMGDPEVMRYIGSGEPKTREQTQRLMGFWIEDGLRNWDAQTLERLPQLRHTIEHDGHLSLWGAVHKSDKRLIGRCGLLAWDLDGQKEVEVGYMIAKKYWGRGLATEAARGIRDYGFDRLHFDRLISLIQPGNVASQRVAIKNGMRHERDVTVKGTDARLYSIRHDDPRPQS